MLQRVKLPLACITRPQKFYSRFCGFSLVCFFFALSLSTRGHILLLLLLLYEHSNASTHAYIRPSFRLFGAKKITLNDDLTCSLRARTAGESFKDSLMEKERKRTDAMMMMMMIMILSRHAYVCIFESNLHIIPFIQWSNLIARQHETLALNSSLLMSSCTLGDAQLK